MYDKEIEVDVVVIGGGLAGIRAAVQSNQAGAKTAMLLKGEVGKSGSSSIAGGGLAAVIGSNEEDSVEKHFLDTLTSGDFVNDAKMVRKMVALAPQAVHELKQLGVEFYCKEGEIQLFLAPAHSYKRSIRCAGGGTARMMAPLSQYVHEQPIQVLENTAVLEILEHEGRVIGVLAVQEDRSLILIRCRAIVLASGGAGRIFPLTSNKEEMTGDGFSIALQHGLSLIGMEFVQFTPTALAFPKELEGTSTGGILLGLEGTRLWNKDRERFMEKYDPQRKEASTRAIVSRAIQKEIMEGRGTPNGGVYLDLTQNDAAILDNIALHFMKKLDPFGINLKEDLLEIAPAVHYFMGGVEVKPTTETELFGLFAAGEVTGGIQGSNRLSSNALTEANVFGKLAGEAASTFAMQQTFSDWGLLHEFGKQKLINKLDLHKGVSLEKELTEIYEQIQQVMFYSVGLERNEEQLVSGIEKLSSIREQLQLLPEGNITQLRKRYEVTRMIDVAEAVVKSAHLRKESRGAHYRSDFSERNDEEWLSTVRATMKNNMIIVEKRDCLENKQYFEMTKQIK